MRPTSVRARIFLLLFLALALMNTELLLYGTSGCHLCDEAQELLKALGNVTWHEIDIADDDTLLARYATRIPVLARPDGSEIGWPFGKDELRTFLKR